MSTPAQIRRLGFFCAGLATGGESKRAITLLLTTGFSGLLTGAAVTFSGLLGLAPLGPLAADGLELVAAKVGLFADRFSVAFFPGNEDGFRTIGDLAATDSIGFVLSAVLLVEVPFGDSTSALGLLRGRTGRSSVIVTRALAGWLTSLTAGRSTIGAPEATGC